MPDLIYDFWKLFKSTFSYFLSLKFLWWQKSVQFWTHWHWLSFKRPTLRGRRLHLEYARGLQNTIKTPSDVNGLKRSQPSLKTSACSPSECGGQWDFCAVLVAGVWQAKEKACQQLSSSLHFPVWSLNPQKGDRDEKSQCWKMHLVHFKETEGRADFKMILRNSCR